MAWVQADIDAFFTERQQMAIPQATVNGGLMAEGIVTVDDLEEFQDEDIKAVQDNLRKPAGTVPDPNNPGQRIQSPSYVLGAKSAKRLKIAAAAVRYYQTIGRTPTAANMHFVNVLKNFGEQWEAIKQKAEDDEPEVPKITRALPIVRWTESFEDFLHQVIGSRYICLSYLVRENVQAANPAPALLPNRCYSEEHGSVMGELISRATHTHTKYKDDNEKLYSFIEEATRSTQYASSIRPFSRAKNGREAYLALKRQYAGTDKWQAEIKKQENFIHTRVWKGNTNFTLESFITQHRAAHVSLERCAEAVPHQVPNERTRVIHLMDAIQCSDAPLQAAIAHIKSQSTDPNGMGSNFEEAAAYLLQFCPVSKKRKSSSSDRTYNVSAVDSKSNQKDSNKRSKPNKGETGVELRYYKPKEYKKLSPDQIDELRQWRKESGLTKDKKQVMKKDNLKDQLIAAIKEVSEEKANKANEQELIRDFLVSVAREEKSDSNLRNGSQTKPTRDTSKNLSFDEGTINAIVKRLK